MPEWVYFAIGAAIIVGCVCLASATGWNTDKHRGDLPGYGGIAERHAHYQERRLREFQERSNHR